MFCNIKNKKKRKNTAATLNENRLDMTIWRISTQFGFCGKTTTRKKCKPELEVYRTTMARETKQRLCVWQQMKSVPFDREKDLFTVSIITELSWEDVHIVTLTSLESFRYFNTGSHTLSKIARLPAFLNLSFSMHRVSLSSLSHISIEGTLSDFQCLKISLLAKMAPKHKDCCKDFVLLE